MNPLEEIRKKVFKETRSKVLEKLLRTELRKEVLEELRNKPMQK